MKKILFYFFIVVNLYSYDTVKDILNKTIKYKPTIECKKVSFDFSKKIEDFDRINDDLNRYIDKKILISKQIKKDALNLLEYCRLDKKNRLKVLFLLKRFILFEKQLIVKKNKPNVTEKELNNIVKAEIAKSCSKIRKEFKEQLNNKLEFHNKNKELTSFSEQDMISLVKINLALNRSIRNELVSCLDSRDRSLLLVDILNNSNQLIELIKLNVNQNN